MKSLALVVAATACSHTNPNVGPIIDVYAFAGDTDPAVGATMIAHRADGTPIDAVSADGVGHGQLVSEDGALITVVFPGDLSPLSTAASLVTLPAPPDDSEVDIHGPPRAGATSVAGVLVVMPAMPLANADHYTIALGCTLTQVSSFPAQLDVNARCLGSDENLDVLVTGYMGTTPLGYAATRVDLSRGSATFAPATWETTPPLIPISVTTPTAPTLEWSLYADGLPFATQLVTTGAPIPTGLAADAATLDATLGTAPSTQHSTQAFAAIPTALAVGPSDFLPAIQPSLTADGTTYHWTPSAVAGADAVDLHMEWDAAIVHITWDALLPPDTGEVALPMFGGDVGALVTPPDSPPAAALRFVAAPMPIGFDAVVAGGIYAEGVPATVMPRPATGEVRASEADGYAP